MHLKSRSRLMQPKDARVYNINSFLFQACVRAMDKTWHDYHFTCWSCDTKFTADSGYHEHNGNPHCEKCYVEATCDKCKGCKKAITDKSVNAMGGAWHLDCFVCKVMNMY